MKKKTKPTSVRLDNELLEELDERCGKLGCSRNDFIKNSVDFIINQSSDFDFGDDEEIEEEIQEKKQDETQDQPSSVTGITITADDGRKWIQDEKGVLHEIQEEITNPTVVWD